MLPSKKRLTREQFNIVITSSTIKTVYNRLGTLKYLPTKGGISVVTSGKNEKSAVIRNKLRRRIYTLFAENTTLSGVLYVSKQSYRYSFEEIKSLYDDLFKKTL